MATQKSDKPADIALNLDTFERESAPGPFAIVLGGKRYVLTDAQECDFRDLIKAQRAFAEGDPEMSLKILVCNEDREAFFANRLPNFKLEAMFTRYNDHFGITNPGEADASPSS